MQYAQQDFDSIDERYRALGRKALTLFQSPPNERPLKTCAKDALHNTYTPAQLDRVVAEARAIEIEEGMSSCSSKSDLTKQGAKKVWSKRTLRDATASENHHNRSIVGHN